MDKLALDALICEDSHMWRKGDIHHVMAPGFMYNGSGHSEAEACHDFMRRNGLEMPSPLMHFTDEGHE